jgi:glycosyltransferase involved in cell wall biosynthesis
VPLTFQSTEPTKNTVLHVRVVTGAGGGPDKTILRSAKYADPQRLRMAAAYLYPKGDAGMATIKSLAKQLRCPLFAIAEKGAVDASALHRLLKLCQELRVTIWHGHDYKSDLLGLVLRRFYPMKLVTTVHGFVRKDLRTRLYCWLDDLALPHYDHVIAVSPPLVRHCLDHGVPTEQLSYIPNAIELAEFTRSLDRTNAKANLGIPDAAPVIGAISRFSPEKGVDRAIHLLANLQQQFPLAQLHLVGDGPQKEGLQSLARRLHVEHAIRWCGWQADTRPFYEAMDMLLLPSHTEGLPNAVLEAMAMKVPVAATDVGAVSDLLDHGRCGIILEPLHHDTWTAPVAHLLNSTPQQHTVVAAAHQRIERHFTFERRMHRVLAIYDRLTDQPAAAAPLHRAA